MNIIKAKYQNITKYIMSILINKTTRLKILNYSRNQSIEVCTETKLLVNEKNCNLTILPELENLQRNGIQAQKDMNGINSMVLNVGKENENIYTNASYADINLILEHKEREYARRIVVQCLDGVLKRISLLKNVPIVENLLTLINIVIPKPVHEIAVKNLGRREVFSLLVDKCGLFFANGFLVSNCDAMLYLLASIEELKTLDPKIEEYKKSLEYANIQRPVTHNLS